MILKNFFLKVERRNLEKHNQAKKSAHESLLLDAIRKLMTDRQEDRQQINKLTVDRQEDRQQITKLTVHNQEQTIKLATLITDREEDRQKMKEQAKRIASLQRDLKEKSDQLNMFQATIFGLQTKVESQASLIHVNAQRIVKMESEGSKSLEKQQKDETTRFEKLEKTFDEHSEEIKHLKTFADRASRLHKTLSHPTVSNTMFNFRHLSGIQTDEEGEKKWHELVEEVKDKDDDPEDCNYLKILNKAINDHSEFNVFPNHWKTNYIKLLGNLQDGDIITTFMKLTCYQQEYISLKTFQDINEFNKESSQNKWFRMSSFVASYIDIKNSCTNFIFLKTIKLFNLKVKNIWLLHNEKEDKKVKVPEDGAKVKLEENFSAWKCFIILKLEFD